MLLGYTKKLRVLEVRNLYLIVDKWHLYSIKNNDMYWESVAINTKKKLPIVWNNTN